MTREQQRALLLRGCQHLRDGLEIIRSEGRYHPSEHQARNLATAFMELNAMTQSPATNALWADQIGDTAERIVNTVSACTTPPEPVS